MDGGRPARGRHRRDGAGGEGRETGRCRGDRRASPAGPVPGVASRRGQGDDRPAGPPHASRGRQAGKRVRRHPGGSPHERQGNAHGHLQERGRPGAGERAGPAGQPLPTRGELRESLRPRRQRRDRHALERRQPGPPGGEGRVPNRPSRGRDGSVRERGGFPDRRGRALRRRRRRGAGATVGPGGRERGCAAARAARPEPAARREEGRQPALLGDRAGRRGEAGQRLQRRHAAPRGQLRGAPDSDAQGRRRRRAAGRARASATGAIASTCPSATGRSAPRTAPPACRRSRPSRGSICGRGRRCWSRRASTRRAAKSSRPR